jgi:integrase
MPRRAPFRVYMDRYLERLRNRSPATRAMYRKWLLELERTAVAVGLTSTPTLWTVEDVGTLLEARASRGDGIPRANTTVRNEIGLLNRYLKSLGNYSMDRALEEGDIRKPPDTKAYRRWKSLEDVILLRATATELEDRTALIVMQLALDAYLRVSEIASLDVADVRGTAIQVRRGKGRKDRVVAITERTEMDIEAYVEGPRKIMLGGSSHNRLVVHTHRGRPSGYSRITMSARVRAVGKACGVDVSPHDLRRTGAQLTYVASPTDRTVRDLQAALGHSTAEQTREYIGAAVVDQHRTVAIRDQYLREMYPETFGQSAPARY